jgi:CxxC-x17-CxxC domain-containing protein
MNFQDKSIRCSECGTTFILSAEKQQVSQSWGFEVEVRRCPSCMHSGKQYGIGSSGNNTHRQMYRATCAGCGKDTEVPFKPRAYRRVYCSNCYQKVGAHR